MSLIDIHKISVENSELYVNDMEYKYKHFKHKNLEK